MDLTTIMTVIVNQTKKKLSKIKIFEKLLPRITVVSFHKLQFVGIINRISLEFYLLLS